MVRDFRFRPGGIVVQVGQQTSIAIENEDRVAHSFMPSVLGAEETRPAPARHRRTDRAGTRRGRGRGAGGGPESGAGLIGLLVVLVALGGIAAVAMAATGGGGNPDTGAGPAGGEGGARPVDAAAVAACRADVAAIETALAAARATGGTYPGALSELASRGFLSALPESPGRAFTAEEVDGRPTGRVLVNGRPPQEGCG